MIKKLLRVLLVLVLLLIIGIVVAWLYVDHLAAKMLTGGIRYAGEVPCEVDSVGVSLLSGSVRVDELAVGNPPGFPQADMFTLGRAEVSVRVSSFWNRPLHIHNLEVIGPVLRVEPGPGGTNVAVFLGNVKGKTGADDEPSRRQERVLVDRLLIKDAAVRIGSGIGPPSLLDVELETVELKDIHGRDGHGVSTGELAAVIVLELVRRGVIKANLDMKKVVPIEVIKGVDAVTRSAGDVIKSAGELLTIPLDKLVPQTRPADEPGQRQRVIVSGWRRVRGPGRCCVQAPHPIRLLHSGLAGRIGSEKREVIVFGISSAAPTLRPVRSAACTRARE